jgi:hypothetical protein
MARETTVKGLRRERPGRYRSADDRFAIEQAGTVWYLTDEARRDELGQALVLGPYASLAEARDALAAEPSVLTWKGKAPPTKAPKAKATVKAAKKAPRKGRRA